MSKVPPHSLEAEESVLGAILLTPSVFDAVAEEATASDFYRASHECIFKTALAMHTDGKSVDVITLTDELEKLGKLAEAGGRKRLHELAMIVPASANAAHYAKIVHEMATLRGLITASVEIGRLGWERPGETSELVDEAMRLV